MKRRIFIDMDGTLAVWKLAAALEDLYQKGYFRNLAPNQNVVDGCRLLVESEISEAYILSSFLSDSEYAVAEKCQWLDEHFPELKGSNRVFVPCGIAKTEAVPGGLRDDDVLLDDYSVNLLPWSERAIGIKLLNGINHTKGTWKGACIRHDDTPSNILGTLASYLQ